VIVVVTCAVIHSLDCLRPFALLRSHPLIALSVCLACHASIVSQHSAANQKERSQPNTGRVSQESFPADIGDAAVGQTSSKAIRRSCRDGQSFSNTCSTWISCRMLSNSSCCPTISQSCRSCHVSRSLAKSCCQCCHWSRTASKPSSCCLIHCTCWKEQDS